MSNWINEEDEDDMPVSKHAPLTEEEEKAIASFKRLAKKWPKSLWLYAASGTMCVMKKDEEDRQAMDGEEVDAGYNVTHIDIECDGGDW